MRQIISGGVNVRKPFDDAIAICSSAFVSDPSAHFGHRRYQQVCEDAAGQISVIAPKVKVARRDVYPSNCRHSGAIHKPVERGAFNARQE